jgi:hypothetical protein
MYCDGKAVFDHTEARGSDDEAPILSIQRVGGEWAPGAESHPYRYALCGTVTQFGVIEHTVYKQRLLEAARQFGLELDSSMEAKVAARYNTSMESPGPRDDTFVAEMSKFAAQDLKTDRSAGDFAPTARARSGGGICLRPTTTTATAMKGFIGEFYADLTEAQRDSYIADNFSAARLTRVLILRKASKLEDGHESDGVDMDAD